MKTLSQCLINTLATTLSWRGRKMTDLEHAILATALLACFFYIGKYIGRKEQVEDIIERTLDSLEKQRFIKVKTLKNGDKELISIDKWW